MLSLLYKLIKRISRGEVFVLLGRFYWFRNAYSNVRRLLENQGRQSPLIIESNAVFSLVNDLPHDVCVGHLKAKGVILGLTLPEPVVQKIYNFALNAECSRPGYDERFVIGEIQNGRLPNDSPVVLADVRDVFACPVIKTIAHHPELLRFFHRYMGYRPSRVMARLFWSLACSHADETRRQLHQPIGFHYDVDGYNTLNAYFYLTDTNESTGAHVVLESTHKKKPLSLLLSSRFHPDDVIMKHYPFAVSTVVVGGRGFGFIEDPACFHKVLPPTTGSRLTLQIRFDSRDRRLEQTYLESNRL